MNQALNWIISIFLFLAYTNNSICVEFSNCIFPNHKTVTANMYLLKALTGEIFEANDVNNQYKYKLSICKQLDSPVKGKTFDKYVSIYQQNIKTPANIYVIGRFNNTDIKVGTNWMILEYGSGNNYTTHCDKASRKAIVMVTCNAMLKKGKLKVIEENNQKNSNCYYLFELEHAALCGTSTKIPVTKPTTISTTPIFPFVSNGGLSGWGIFFIIFVSVAAFYLAIGVIIKGLIWQEKGIEMIPNITFWRLLGSKFADCVECLCRPKTDPRNRNHYDSLQNQPATTDQNVPPNFSNVPRGNLTLNDFSDDELDTDLVLP